MGDGNSLSSVILRRGGGIVCTATLVDGGIKAFTIVSTGTLIDGCCVAITVLLVDGSKTVRCYANVVAGSLVNRSVVIITVLLGDIGTVGVRQTAIRPPILTRSLVDVGIVVVAVLLVNDGLTVISRASVVALLDVGPIIGTVLLENVADVRVRLSAIPIPIPSTSLVDGCIVVVAIQLVNGGCIVVRHAPVGTLLDVGRITGTILLGDIGAIRVRLTPLFRQIPAPDALAYDRIVGAAVLLINGG